MQIYKKKTDPKKAIFNCLILRPISFLKLFEEKKFTPHVRFASKITYIFIEGHGF